uniref:Uncharacterized protein n=1 Tax=Arundo donax TaxID=35708 RepID=A0A0A9BQ04_ARUDO
MEMFTERNSNEERDGNKKNMRVTA